MAACYHAVAPACLVVGEEIVGLCSVGFGNHSHIGSEENVGKAVLVEEVAVGVLVDAEDDAVVAPAVKAVDWCRPHYLVASAIGCDEVVV